MIDLDRAYPVPTHMTWQVHDASKLQQFMDCERQYFFKYVLGWQPEGKSNHLIFGQAWHNAMEAILHHGYTPEGIDKGMQDFLVYYREYLSEHTDMQYHPKDPGNAQAALIEYCATYRDIDRPIDVLQTEISGMVPVADDRNLHFRFDAVCRDPARGVFVREHKTAGRPFPSWKGWEDSWLLSTQVSLYAHALYCLYPDEKIKGVEVNATFFQVKENKFKRIPVAKSPAMLNAFLWDINHRLDMLEWNFDRLTECTPDDPVMYSFPKNTQSCTKYFGCPFADFCIARPNPLSYVHTGCPQGYEIEWWDPRDRDKTVVEVKGVDYA